ncbi:hypothetical protein D3C84_628260 [compost metagenome]
MREQRPLGDAAANLDLLERPAHDNAGVVGDQVDHTVMAHVDTVVERKEVTEIEGDQRHAGEAAIGMIDATRHRHDPFTGGTALDRRANVRATIGVITVEDEILAVGIVRAGHDGAIGIGDPAPLFVINEQTMNLAQLTALGREQPLEPWHLARGDAVVFKPVDQREQQRIGLLDRRLCLRGQGLRKVGHGHFLVVQMVLARVPGFPDHDGGHGQAHREQQKHHRANLEASH